MPRHPGTRAWIERSRDGDGRRRYRIRWVDPDTGKRCSEPCGTDSALARELLGQVMSRLRMRRLGVCGDPSKRISDLVARIPELLAGKSSTSIAKLMRALSGLSAAVGDRRLLAVDREAVIVYRAKRVTAGVAPATVNGDLRSIKSAMTCAVDCRWIPHNPLLRWKGLFLLEPERTPRVVEADEFSSLLRHCDAQLSTALMLAYYAGLRRREITDLQWPDVDLDGHSLLVRNRPDLGELTKSRKIRIVPMREAVVSEVSRHLATIPMRVSRGRKVPRSAYVFGWPDGRPWDEDWLTHQFADVARTAGVQCTLHDLRRSFSTLAQRAGIDRHVVKDLGGWSSVTVVERHYTGSITPALQAAIRRLDQQAS